MFLFNVAEKQRLKYFNKLIVTRKVNFSILIKLYRNITTTINPLRLTKYIKRRLDFILENIMY